MGVLGCGETQVFVTSNCRAGGTSNILLKDLKEVEWGRRLDDISEARVVISVSGDAECCTQLRDIYPWCSYLVIFRDNLKVWEGPITNVIFKTDEVEIEALDPLAWLLVRIPTGTLDNSAGPAMEITDLGRDVLEAAFAEHDPCVLDNIVQTDISLNKRPTRYANTRVAGDKFPPFQGTLFDWLTLLSEAGLDYTVVAGQVFLGVDSPGLGLLGTLRDNHIIGEIEVHRDGFLQANRVYVRYFEDDASGTPVPVRRDAPNFFCFGPIEKLIEGGAEFDFDTAVQTGDGFIDGAAITPTLIEIPSGAQLTPEAPFEINQLFPGVQINVAITDLCFPINDAFQLLEVNFKLDEDNQEEIRIVLGELNQISGLT